MRQEADRIHELIMLSLRQELDPGGQAELDQWVNESDENKELFARLTDEHHLREDLRSMDRLPVTDVWENGKVWAEVAPGTRDSKVIPLDTRRRWSRLAVAGIIVFLFGASLWGLYLINRGKSQRNIAAVQDIAPGGNKAMLRLGNGSVIQLNSTGIGELAKQGNTRVIKLDSGQLAYKASLSAGTEALYNTIITPRGGQYEVILVDGTKVWLNAASSLKFPTAFTGKQRTVTLTGEAYFEVADHAGKPFRVEVPPTGAGKRGTVIEVLGTHFDVMAYADEPEMKTTLVEGSLRVVHGNASALLKPGDQADVSGSSPEDQVRVIPDADISETVAWKDGLFKFRGNDIQSVMRQLSRWYDVDIKYEGNVSAHFLGTISRNVHVSEVFKILELTGAVDFKIEGKTIIVLSQNK